MKDIATALYQYFSGFDIPVFVENAVPDEIDGVEVEPPYITYQVSKFNWNQNGTMQVRIWYVDYLLSDIFTKADEITNDIGTGKTLTAGDGFIYLAPGSPLSQLQPSDELNLKIVYINLGIKTIL